MGYFGKAIALLFYTEILNQNNAFLVHKNTSNRVNSWLKRIYALFGVVWGKFWMKKFMIKKWGILVRLYPCFFTRKSLTKTLPF